jgi:hypothetical protein
MCRFPWLTDEESDLTQFQFSGPGGGSGRGGRRQAPPPPVMPPPSDETVLDRGVTMWGASATGKTSFLAALYIALMDQQTGWRLRGDDQASVQELTRLTNALTNKGVFPQATERLQEYHWSLVGRKPITEWHWYGPRRRNANVVIPMPVVDVSGEVVDADEPHGHQMTERFVESLANSTGIVFFYDPIREFERGDAFQHTFGVLAELDARMKTHGPLPHHVAVCVTKFDEQRMLDAALRMGLVDYELDPPYSPRVMDKDAREFFARICGVSKTRNARRILSLLEGTFDPGRIQYFVTSAIGFYVDPLTGLFNSGDYQQHIARDALEVDSKSRIRGDIRPITK